MISISTDNWEIEGIGCILLDKDGLLIDSNVYWGRIVERRVNAIIDRYNLNKSFFSGICLSMGYAIDKKNLIPEGPIALVGREEVIRIVNNYLLGLGVKSVELDLSAIFTDEHSKFMKEIKDYIKMLPGVSDFLSSIKSLSVKTAIVTSDSIRNTEEIIMHFKIDKYIDIIIGKESTAEAKATGRPAIMALRKLNAKEQDSVSIGDAPVDLLMARAGGLKAGIGVASGQVPYDTLKKYSEYVAASMKELRVN